MFVRLNELFKATMEEPQATMAFDPSDAYSGSRTGQFKPELKAETVAAIEVDPRHRETARSCTHSESTDVLAGPAKVACSLEFTVTSELGATLAEARLSLRRKPHLNKTGTSPGRIAYGGVRTLSGV